MNRADFHWLLSSVQPHVGTHHDTAYVTLTSDSETGMLFAVSTDQYSLAISRIPYLDHPPIKARVSRPEVKEVLRMVKPSLVAHHAETLDVAIRPGELHLATEADSAVFETAEPGGVTVEWALRVTQRIWLLEPAMDGVYDAALLTRFSKAERVKEDRLTLHHRAGRNAGLAVITVGDNHVGAVCGIGDGFQPVRSTMLDLLEREVLAA